MKPYYEIDSANGADAPVRLKVEIDGDMFGGLTTTEQNDIETWVLEVARDLAARIARRVLHPEEA